MLRWTVHLRGGPERSRHTVVSVGHRVYSFAGRCNANGGGFPAPPLLRHTLLGKAPSFIDVHVFNTLSLRWTKLTSGRGERRSAPSMREDHTAVPVGDVVYVWGGITVAWEFCDALHAFDVSARRWSRPAVSGTLPEARCGHSACVRGKVMYVFGGYRGLAGCTDDLSALDTAAMVWSRVHAGGGGGGPPPALQCHSAVVVGTRMLVFGGRGDEEDAHHGDETRVFDTEAGRWLRAPPSSARRHPRPAGREGHSAFAHGGEMYVFGGHDRLLKRMFNDLWKLNPRTFSWTKVETKGKVPCPRMSRMSCCVVGDRVVLSGSSLEPHTRHHLYILELRSSLKTLCKLAVIRYALAQSGLPHDIRWELAAMTANSYRTKLRVPLNK